MKILLAICAFSALISSIICSYYVAPCVPRNGTTDGPFWHFNKLYFVDTYNHQLCAYHASGGSVFCATLGTGLISFAVPVKNYPNFFLVGSNKTILLLSWDSYSNVEHAETRLVLDAAPNIGDSRITYGTVDPKGRLWFAARHNYALVGKVFSYTWNREDRLRIRMLHEYNLCNGIQWFLQEEHAPKFYFVNGQTNKLELYTYHMIQGNVRSGPFTIFDLEDVRHLGIPAHARLGIPAIDSRGWMWLPIYEGSHVILIDTNNRKVKEFIYIPAVRVSACAFGGSDLNFVFVTTMGHGIVNRNEVRPHDDDGGHIYVISRLPRNVHGFPTYEYSWN